MATGSTLYLRLPTETKEAVDAYSEAKGYTLTAGATALLQLGLEAEQDRQSVTAMQVQVGELRQLNVDLQEALQKERTARASAEQQRAMWNHVSNTWSVKSSQIVGRCPSCQTVLRGSDVLVSGVCPKPGCGQGVGAALAGGPGMDTKELLLVLGAAGLMLGLLVAASKGT